MKLPKLLQRKKEAPREKQDSPALIKFKELVDLVEKEQDLEKLHSLRALTRTDYIPDGDKACAYLQEKTEGVRQGLFIAACAQVMLGVPVSEAVSALSNSTGNTSSGGYFLPTNKILTTAELQKAAKDLMNSVAAGK